jgi:PAS domain S-box-containing protein
MSSRGTSLTSRSPSTHDGGWEVVRGFPLKVLLECDDPVGMLGAGAGREAPRALVVDDDAVTRQFMSLTLRGAGIDTIVAAEGSTALEYAREQELSIVLLDNRMPGMCGREVLERLRNDPRTRTLPVILVTGDTEVEDRVGGLEAGADDYLAKPVDPAELVATVRAVLRGRSGEAMVRQVVDSANDAYVAWDESGAIAEWNARASDMFGWQKADAIGRSFDETILALPSRAGLDQMIQRFLAIGAKPLLGEWVEMIGLHRSGRELPIELTVWVVEGTGTRTFHALVRDLSRRRELENDLEQSATLHEVVDATPDVITLSDASGILHVSPACRAVLGYDPEELVGHPIEELVHSDERAAFAVAVQAVLESGIGFMSSYRVRAKDGRHVWMESSARPMQDAASGKVTAVQTVARNITKRKLIEEESERAAVALAQTNRNLSAALDREQGVVEELLELDRAKTRFVSTVSHELRTPLTSIMGYVEMLTDQSLGRLDGGQARAADAIARNTDRLLAMIEDLLTISRADSGEFHVAPQPGALGAIIESATSVVRPIARGREISMHVDVPPDLPEVFVDATCIDRVLLNLLSNAIKFTPSGGQVGVAAHREADLVAVTVTDDGMGIPADEQTKIFQRFARASTATEQEIQGSGLGLFIVKTIVELHGGTVSLRSAPEQGTEVTFTLRCANARVPEISVS